MRVAITRRFEIDAGHRLLRHESKCRNVHGHRYVFEVSLSATSVDQVGRVVDFGVLKQLLGSWLDAEWDHGMLVEEGDPLASWLESEGMKHRVLAVPPSAENLARIFFDVATRLVGEWNPEGRVKVENVRIYETPNCVADYPGACFSHGPQRTEE
ncbi:MAG: 6-carboxytetrahydropterin synthase [Deltaproteobacteria bacterium]|nr:6-carboxytetrahydropterin synthase [Deltaproteobacteria bacterium]